ncbi:Nif3-like dinuclear metal center hexameric protein [Arenibacter sp. GZD96]|uniref:Nif3-like dinuclear metal center hexameric protein n=1 Tax=Aurantibrevibacter litoralis TaxID=3106030 RepID=UPI002B00259E|nr:Nif3-like dinuclear metal center hexameric protein [Arenibacter sp. GZD-96]MEA1786682.1 Nif3-like dinuclear metal center hexameric protein [Arenibacter sp. GZD-96]
MIVNELTAILEELAPLAYAEDFDNVGLLVGHPDMEVTGVLVTLDTLEAVVDEAIERKCNLIISFHPIIFGGLKKLNGHNYVERTVLKAIKHDIAIYSMHTALDNCPWGVNAKISEILALTDTRILIPKTGTIKKLIVHVPQESEESVQTALFTAGGGTIGNYSHCSFGVTGLGSFKPNAHANPVKGHRGEVHVAKETQLHITFPSDRESHIMQALFNSHPYEEVAYEITTLDNTNQNIGMGMIGRLQQPMEEAVFLDFLKERMKASVIRHSALLGKKIQTVAVLGGSGAFAIANAKKAGADIFVTADVKYHQFFEAEGKMIIADLGHYETEQFTKNLIVDYLTKKIPNFAIANSERITNPIKYY